MRGAGVRLGALAVILACIGVRVCVSFEPVPYWDGDPTVLSAPSSALGPTASIVIDVCTLLASVVAFVSLQRVARPSLLEAALVFVPAVALWMHFGTSVEDVRLGSAWLSAAVGALAIKSLCADAGLRRIAMASLLAVPLMLAVEGASQVFVEHAQTVRAFEQNREQFLAAQGWTPDSAQARAFERRLRQPEATAWFGLSNVYATFAAFGLVAFTGLLAASRRAPGKTLIVLFLGTIACAASLWLAQSKGGVGAALVGAVLLVLGFLARRGGLGGAARSLLAKTIGVGVIVAVLLAVIARGLLGDRLAEFDLSIWFRWFYMQGAARIFAANPLWGVGPAGFKDAYMLAKPVLSPEEVTSPHSVLLDFGATLGVCGLAWCAWWAWLAARNGQATLATVAEPDTSLARDGGIERRVLFLVCAVSTVAGAFAERHAATPEAAIFRVVGMLLGTLGAIGVREALAVVPSASWAFAAAALAVIAHVQIEVTAVWVNSCAWVIATVACGASMAGIGTEKAAPPRGPWAAIGGALALVVIGFRVPGVNGWEQGLRRAADEVRVSAELRARLQALGSGAISGDSLGELSAEISRLQGREIGDTMAALQHEVGELQEADATRALGMLADAATRYPDAGQTWRAAARLSMQLATARLGRGEKERALEDAVRAEGYARRACDLVRSRAASNSWLGTLLVARADMFEDPAALNQAAEAWERSAALDPFGIYAPVKLAELHARLGNGPEARTWAKRALERDEQLRLDPLVGLTAAQRAAFVKLAGGS